MAVCWVSALTALASPKSATLTPAVVGDQHVLGLDVAVDQAGPVGGGERGEHRLDQRRAPGAASSGLLADQVAQGVPGTYSMTRKTVPVVVALVVDADDVAGG